MQLSLLEWRPAPPIIPAKTVAPAWTQQDLDLLVALYTDRDMPDVAAIAKRLGRTYSMVACQASRMGLSFTKRGTQSKLRQCIRQCGRSFWSEFLLEPGLPDLQAVQRIHGVRMMSDVIKLDDHRKPEPCVVHNDRAVTVWDREYNVRRTAWSGNPAGGWFTVRDAGGQMMFVRAGDLPDPYIRDLIMAWLDGNGVGRRHALAAKGYTGEIA